MGLLYTQLAQILPSGMFISEPLQQLYDWIEIQNTYVDGEDGMRYG